MSESFFKKTYLQASEEFKNENTLKGLELLKQGLSYNSDNFDIVIDYDSLDSKLLPQNTNSNWIHNGEGKYQLAANILGLVTIGHSESVFEHELKLSKNGLILDFIMYRIGGGEENCQLLVDTNLGAELIRFNINSVHLSSNSSKIDIDFSHYHSFRLIIEDNLSILYIDGKPSLVSSPLPSKNLNKIIFGNTHGFSNADFASMWAKIRVGQGKNLLQSIDDQNLDDAFLLKAKKFYDSDQIPTCLHELQKSILLNPDNPNSINLLPPLMENISARDPSVYLLDEIVDRINDQNIIAIWNEKKNKLHRKKLVDVENVGVKFLTSMNTGTIVGLWDSIFSKTRNQNKHFWALKDVSLSVYEGEILGIIGRNGSGKSTLLRTISGIISPDTGSSNIDGRSILLSAGMGFREELSGLDNIYLGCLFMGMKRHEIEEQLETIINFAELQNDIHRTFKYYSDGMKSRLSFSVATHIKHDILLLDELLSAGDLSFNRKAAKRMEELVVESKTAVIVTHATQFVRDYCTRVLYLEKGNVKYFGDPDKAVDMYVYDSQVSFSEQ